MKNKKFNFIKKEALKFSENQDLKIIKLDFKNEPLNYTDYIDNFKTELIAYLNTLSIIIIDNDDFHKEIHNNFCYLHTIILLKNMDHLKDKKYDKIISFKKK